jgi:hypothetical protein
VPIALTQKSNVYGVGSTRRVIDKASTVSILMPSRMLPPIRCRLLEKNCYYHEARSNADPPGKDSEYIVHYHQLLHTTPRRIVALEAKVNRLLSNSSTLSSQNEDVIDRGLLSIERAGELFERYRTKMAPHFPFVVIDP